MRFGYFDDSNREYVITTPKTPYPWINYLGSENFFGLVSNQAGGYCFYQDARLRRLTRYRYNNVPTDVGGRYFYIHEAGDYWTPSWGPTKKELSAYECRHGLGYTKISGTRNALKAELLFFVPMGETCEVHQVTLKNESAKAQHRQALQLHRVLPVECAGRRHQLPAQLLHRRGRGRGQHAVPQDRVPRATQPLRVLPRERQSGGLRHRSRDLPWPVQWFLGTGRGDARQVGNSVASGWSPIASHCLEVELAPGEEKSFVFVLGYVENPQAEKWESPGIINKTRAAASDREVLLDREGRRGRAPEAEAALEHAALRLLRAVERREARTGWSTSGISTSAW